MNLITSSINHTGATVGFSINANDEFAVDPNVSVTADAYGIEMNVDSHLFNYGGILSSGAYAIMDSASAFAEIFNGSQATVVGVSGIGISNGAADIQNLGTIMGLVGKGIDVFASAEDTIIGNYGYIFGNQAGVREYSSSFGGAIANSGTITSSQDGILVDTLTGLITTIVNSGLVHGNNAIYSHAGSVSLSNTGTLDGNVVCAANASDSIHNSGVIVGVTALGPGDDLFNGSGGSSGKIYGQEGADRIIGGSHGDTMDGGVGKDVLTGGLGADHFVFSVLLNPVTNVDRITDFSVPLDTIDLDNLVFPILGASGKLAPGMFYKGAHAHDANDHVIYNPVTGALIYDANGGAAGGELRFATLSHNLAITAADFLVV